MAPCPGEMSGGVMYYYENTTVRVSGMENSVAAAKYRCWCCPVVPSMYIKH